MITMLSQRISHYLVVNGADTNEEEVLTYGAECFLNQLIANALLVIVGLLTNHVWEVLIWSLSFTLLRVNLGGLHAPSHVWCIVTGTLVGASSIIISPFLLAHVAISAILALMATVTAIVIAPVPHKNKQHVQRQKKEIKRKVIIISILECVATVVIYFLSPVFAFYIVSGLIMATVLAAAGLKWNPR
jgi:accessory gene regulator B